MQLTRRRDEFFLIMDEEELLFLIRNLGSDPVSVEENETTVSWLKSLIKTHASMTKNKEILQKLGVVTVESSV